MRALAQSSSRTVLTRYEALRKYFCLSSQMRVCWTPWTHNPLLPPTAPHRLSQSSDWSYWAGKELGKARRATPS
ncbi:hypothetical protein PBY51_002773 [Eleginops maclovinus]|uniref:Uncharacterized protein n=1 Tax=Eleginops maclovinus TaxID=56733 RepID=A0AAN7XAS8_ELEMC|nr:hypothetical protein PBY51_002773 [Eleginops maclovinus]